MNKFRRSLISVLSRPSTYTQLLGKLDIDFKDNKYNSIGTTNFNISSSRGLTFNNDNLILNNDAYMQISISNQFSRENTIQILVEETPTNDDISNWFRVSTARGDLIFGYMTEEVLNAKKPFVLTFLLSETQPRVKTYLNDVLISTENPSRYLWNRLQIGAGDTTPQPSGLTIKRFRIFDTRINDSEVKYYYKEMLTNS